MSEIDDIEAIRRLSYEYAMAVDTMNLDAVTELFTSDAVLDLGPDGPPQMNDRDAITDFFRELFEGSSNLFHLTSNHIIEVDGDLAKGTVYYAASGVTSEGSTFGASGYYSDIYVRSDDGWKFQRRNVVALL